MDQVATQASATKPRARAYVRHPGDVLRVVLGALVLLATMTAIHRDRIGVRETDVFRLINDLALPWWTRWPVWLVMQLGVIGAVPLVALLALATRRIRLAAYAALAGGTIYLAAAAGVRAPQVLLMRSFGNGAGLLVQQRVAGRDLTDLGDERLDDAMLADVWRQLARLRAARIAHGDLGLASVVLDEQGKAWLVDFDRAEAAASQPLLDRDLDVLLAALGRVADPARVRATAEQTLGEEAPGQSRRPMRPRNAVPPT